MKKLGVMRCDIVTVDFLDFLYVVLISKPEFCKKNLLSLENTRCDRYLKSLKFREEVVINAGRKKNLLNDVSKKSNASLSGK
jgi:hypothetical protein